MFNSDQRKICLPSAIPKAIGLCVALSLFVSLSSTQFTMAQQTGTTANLSGIQCVQGRAMSLGINCNNDGGFLRSDSILAALDQSGVGWVRLAIPWGWTERKPGVYDWQHTDAVIDRALSVHVTPLVVIMGPIPCWTSENPQPGCKWPQHQLPQKQDWSNFVSAVVSRYKGRVQYWEIWNEPNLTSTIDIPDLNQRLTGYREQILIPGAEAVHAADPSAKVVGPAFAGNGFSKGALGDAIKLVLKPPAAQLIDVVSFHSYFPGDINGKAIEIRDAMRSLGIGTKPIWLTETGLGPQQLGIERFAGSNYVESRQANFLQTNVLDLLASGKVQKVFWFALTDSHDVHHLAIDHFGLVDETGSKFTPRPAYTELQLLIQSACR